MELAHKGLWFSAMPFPINMQELIISSKYKWGYDKPAKSLSKTQYTLQTVASKTAMKNAFLGHFRAILQPGLSNNCKLPYLHANKATFTNSLLRWCFKIPGPTYLNGMAACFDSLFSAHYFCVDIIPIFDQSEAKIYQLESQVQEALELL